MVKGIWDRYEDLWNGDDFDAREKLARSERLPNDLVLDRQLQHTSNIVSRRTRCAGFNLTHPSS